jgi:hypothetical protein
MGLTPPGLHHFVVNTFEGFIFGLHFLVGIIDFVTILHEEMHDPGDVLGLGTPVVSEVVFHDGGAFGGPLTIVTYVDRSGVFITVVLVIGDHTGICGDFFIVLTVIVPGDFPGTDGAAILGDAFHFIFQDHMGSLDVKPALVDDLKITAVELEVVNELVGTHGFPEPVIHTDHIESVVGGVIIIDGIVIDGDGGRGGRGHDRLHVCVNTFKELYLL